MIRAAFHKMAIIKKPEECTPEYVEKLRLHLKQNAQEYFHDKNNQACAWDDFDYFNKKTDREHLVMPNEVMLIDRDYNGVHMYVICKIGDRKEVRQVTHVAPVIAVEEIPYGIWRNGYFLLPKL